MEGNAEDIWRVEDVYGFDLFILGFHRGFFMLLAKKTDSIRFWIVAETKIMGFFFQFNAVILRIKTILFIIIPITVYFDFAKIQVTSFRYNVAQVK